MIFSLSLMLRNETKKEKMFHVKQSKRTITYRYKPSAICYKAIADGIYKTLEKEKKECKKSD